VVHPPPHGGRRTDQRKGTRLIFLGHDRGCGHSCAREVTPLARAGLSGNANEPGDGDGGPREGSLSCLAASFIGSDGFKPSNTLRLICPSITGPYEAAVGLRRDYYSLGQTKGWESGALTCGFVRASHWELPGKGPERFTYIHTYIRVCVCVCAPCNKIDCP
jgi:hypothetical protein